MRQIPMAQPDIGERERELVNEVLDSGTLALGPMAVRFEEALAAVVGRRYGVSCSSGTAGLHMVVRALGIGPGDEVITTPFSFVASANCLLYEQATPRFVDIEPDSLGLDPATVAAAAGPRTVGVLPVHVFGRPCRIDELAATAEERGWHLIEDACEALGSSVGGRAMGSYGAASVFAFYPNKQIRLAKGAWSSPMTRPSRRTCAACGTRAVMPMAPGSTTSSSATTTASTTSRRRSGWRSSSASQSFATAERVPRRPTLARCQASKA